MRTQLINRTGSIYGATNWGRLPRPGAGDIEVIEGAGPPNPLKISTWVGALTRTAGCGAGCDCAPCFTNRTAGVAPGFKNTGGVAEFMSSAVEDVKAVATDPTAKRPMNAVQVAVIALGIVLLFGR